MKLVVVLARVGLTIRQAAAALRTSRQTVMRLIEQGELTVRRAGAGATTPLLVDAAAIRALIERHTVGGSAE